MKIRFADALWQKGEATMEAKEDLRHLQYQPRGVLELIELK